MKKQMQYTRRKCNQPPLVALIVTFYVPHFVRLAPLDDSTNRTSSRLFLFSNKEEEEAVVVDDDEEEEEATSTRACCDATTVECNDPGNGDILDMASSVSFNNLATST